uniref:Ubiquinone biosynthesis O-methyltransferase, mitochondrial n=1 Tax=Hanusia phi TaxID=3032 RepID=A0A7S0ETZ2_9CRYP
MRAGRRLGEERLERRKHSTVDADEVNKFGAIGRAWWDVHGPQKALHSLNALRVPFLQSMLNQTISRLQAEKKQQRDVLEDLSIVDVGCGGGILAEQLSHLGAHVLGIDAAKENIQVAEEHAKMRGMGPDGGEDGRKRGGSLTYRHVTADDLIREQRTFDVVVCSEVLEHVSDLRLMVNQLMQLVAPQGSLYITTMNKTVMSYGLGIVAAERLLKLVPDGTHDWNKFVKPEDLTQQLTSAGFNVKRILGAAYNPLTNRWHPVPDLSVNYLLFAHKQAAN